MKKEDKKYEESVKALLGREEYQHVYHCELTTRTRRDGSTDRQFIYDQLKKTGLFYRVSVDSYSTIRTSEIVDIICDDPKQKKIDEDIRH